MAEKKRNTLSLAQRVDLTSIAISSLSRYYTATETAVFLRKVRPNAPKKSILEAIKRAKLAIATFGRDEDAAKHKRNAVALYTSIIRDPAASRGERMAAQAALDRIYGNYAPVKYAETDAAGHDKPSSIAVILKGNDQLADAMLQLSEKLIPGTEMWLDKPDEGDLI